MTPPQLSSLLVELLGLSHETEWVEWKHNNSDPAMIASICRPCRTRRRCTGAKRRTWCGELKTEWTHEKKPVVLFESPRASHAPVRFGSEEFIRVGSLKKKLKD